MCRAPLWPPRPVTVVFWASAFVGIRAAAPYFSPGSLALGRLLAGSVVLVLFLAVRREGLPPRAAWPGIVVSGVLWFGLYMVALNWGEELVDAGTAAMIVNVGPALMALLAGWLLNEGFPPRLLAGIAVSFAGTVVVGLSMSGGGRSSVLGVLLCLVAAVTYASGVVAQKPALKHASALQATTFGCLIGMVAVPAVRRPAGVRRGRGAALGHAQRRLPGRLPDRGRVHDLGLRPGPDHGGPGWARPRTRSRSWSSCCRG